MDARIDALLKRVGRRACNYSDELELRTYIIRLEARLAEAEVRLRGLADLAAELRAQYPAAKEQSHEPG